MATNQYKKVYRQLGVFVGVSTTLFSICGPILESKVYAETMTKGSVKVIPTMPDASSLVNYDPEFTSSLDTSSLEETTVTTETTAPIESSSNSESNTSTSEGDPTNTPSESTTESTTKPKPPNNTTSSSKEESTNSTTDSTDASKPTTEEPSHGNSNNTPPKSSESSTSASNANSGSTSSTSKASDGAIKFSKSQSTVEFIEEIGESARQIGQENNLYASVMIAQAILESSSGNSGLAQAPNYNLFGIKGSYKGSSVEMATLEDNGSGSMYTISAKFRKYPSYKESLQDYATLMTGGTSGMSTYYQGAWKSNTSSYKDATKYLTGRYATDTRYNEKLNGLIETYQLAKYDEKESEETKIKKSNVTEDFIKEIATDSKDIAEKNDLYASVMIADAIINSSSGENTLAQSHNLFQIEGKYDENSVELETIKQDDGKPSLSKITYKEYPSYKDSLNDYVFELKKETDVYSEMTTSKKDSYKKVTAYLTAQNNNDLNYHKKLNALIATYDLAQYDKEVKVEEKKTNETAKTANKANIDIINKIGKTMIDKVAEGIEQPTKYQVTQK